MLDTCFLIKIIQNLLEKSNLLYILYFFIWALYGPLPNPPPTSMSQMEV